MSLAGRHVVGGMLETYLGPSPPLFAVKCQKMLAEVTKYNPFLIELLNSENRKRFNTFALMISVTCGLAFQVLMKR